MVSLIGPNFPTLVILAFAAFSLVLLWASISDNWNAHRAGKRKTAADREVPRSTRVRSR